MAEGATPEITGINNPLNLAAVDLEKINAPPKRDYSKFWGLPANVNDLAFRRSTSLNTEPVITGSSSITEGRVVRLPRFVFEFKGSKLNDMEPYLPFEIPKEHLPQHNFLRPVNFSALIEKGGGLKPDHQTPIPPSPEGPNTLVTYLNGKVLGDQYGAIAAGSADDSEQKVDESFSILFHLWGGRTRLPIATFPQEKFSTPDGIINREQAIAKGYFKDPKVETVVSLWGMRCPWTIDDITGTFSNPDTMTSRAMAKFFAGMVHPGVEFFKTQPQPSPQTAELGISFAKDLVSYAQNDDDPRWKEFANKYKEVDENNLSQFYSDYLPLLSSTFGEQLGILYRHRVYLYKYNLQNVSALGEIKDFDVAAFNATHLIDGSQLTKEDMVKSCMLTQTDADAGKKPDEPVLWANTVFSTIESLTGLFCTLRVPGIINSSSDEFKAVYHKAISAFSKGFVKHGFRDGLAPQSINRNMKMLTTLDEFYANSNLWWDEPNAFGSAFTGLNKYIYTSTINRAKNKRYEIALKNAV